MTRHEYDVSAALVALRGAVNAAVKAPPAATLRARAQHRQRVRAMLRAGAAAAAAVAIALGAAAVVRGHGQALPPPIGPSSPVTTPVTTPSLAPTPVPRPSRPVPPGPKPPLTDPIASVNWREATIAVPPRPGCPSGLVRFRANISVTPDPKMAFAGLRRFGDLTGDGRPEAILEAICGVTPQGDDYSPQLLVVSRHADGSLTGLGWAGPLGGLYREAWVDHGRLITDVRPYTSESTWSYSLGSALAYRWAGVRFDQVDSGYPGIAAPGDASPSAVVDLGPSSGYVARSLNCPGGEVQFRGAVGAPLEAVAGDVVYSAENGDNVTHLVDLAGDGHRYLLVAISCRDAATSRDDAVLNGAGRGRGILVLDQRPGARFVAVDLVGVAPGRSVAGWDVERGKLTVRVSPATGGAVTEEPTWTWNGAYFQR